MSYRSVLNVSNGGPSNPKLTLKTNSLRIKRKAQNFASWMLSEYAFKIGIKKGNDFLIIVPLSKRNISQQCWAQHVALFWQPGCDVLDIENPVSARARAQQCCTNLAKRVQHHITSTNVASKI